MAQIWPQVHNFVPLDLCCGLPHLDSDNILTNFLGFGPLCLDLDHFAQIWAIFLGFGLFGRIWVRINSKEDKALRMHWGMNGQRDLCTEGQTDFPCVLKDFVPFGALALLPLNFIQTPLKHGIGTADHLLPLGCH